MQTEDKQIELQRIRAILLASFDYLIATTPRIKSDSFDSQECYEDLKAQTNTLFLKGRLSELKKWLKDVTEGRRECFDFNYIGYIKEKTGYDFDIFLEFEQRIQKIENKKKITTPRQYVDVLSMADFLSQMTPTNQQRIDKLNELLLDYTSRQTKSRNGQGSIPKDYHSLEVDFIHSPDGSKYAMIFESGEKMETAITQVMVTLAEGKGGGGIFAANGAQLGLKVRWRDNSSLEIQYPKNLTVNKKEFKIQSHGDKISIDYIEA